MSFRVHDTHEYLKKTSQPLPENVKKDSNSTSTVSSESKSSRLIGSQPSGIKIKTSDATAHCDYF